MSLPQQTPRVPALSGTWLFLRQFIALSMFALLPVASGAATYYFSTSGNDANAGTDPSAPKQSLSAAASLASAGNTLLFKRGDAWYAPAANPAPLDLRNKAGDADNYIRFDAYGSGPKPVISSLASLGNGGWTNVAGTTTWQQAVTGFSDAWRLYVNGVSKFKLSDEAAVNEPHEWAIKAVSAGSSAIVYVNTGSSTVGPQNVEIHPVSARSVVLMENTHYLSMRNLDFRGGSQFNVIYVEAASSHLIFDENIIQRAYGSGLLVTNLSSPADEYVSNVTITNNLIDKVWSTQENDLNVGLTGDGLFILHAVDTGVIRGNTIRNWGHTGITLSSYRAGFHGVHNFIVEQNNVSSDISGYTHALDVNGFEGLTTHHIIRRNIFHDYQATIHAQGNHNQFYSNLFVGVTLTPMINHSKQPWGMDLIPWRFTDGNWMAAHDNYIVNNTFVGTQQYSIVMGDDPASTSIVGNNVVANNIIYSFGPAPSGELGLNVAPAVRGEIPVLNNAFWDFSTTAPVVRYKGSTNYTATQLNTLFPQSCSGNVQVDPGFADVNRRDFRLTAGSPQSVRTGGRDMSAELGAGFVDFNGNPWNPGSPSMGAFQFASDEVPLSQGRSVSYSSIQSGESTGTPASYLTDGDSSVTHLVAVGNANQLVSATIDLGYASRVQRLKMWHYWSDGRIYRDVIVQLSTTSDFSSGVTTVFNNDTNNSAGFGAGADAEYAESAAGKEVVLGTPVIARYARFFAAGNSANGFSHFAELQVFGYANTSIPPTFTVGPVSLEVTAGASASFTSTVVGNTPLTYQWRKGGVPIAGATGATYTIPSTVAADAGTFDVVATNPMGSTTSAPATLIVTAIDPNIEQNLSQGKPVTYSAIRSGESSGSPVSYLTDGDTSLTRLVAVGNAGQLVSVTVNLPQLSTITRLKMWHYWGDGRIYRDVIVQLSTTPDFSSGVATVFNNDTNNSAGFGVGQDAEYSETSAGKQIVLSQPITARYARFYIAANSVNAFNHYVELQVFGYPLVAAMPAISSGPASQVVTSGDAASFEVVAAASPTPTYQWRKGGTPITGATSARYSIPMTTAADAGYYDVVVSNVLGSITSSPATLAVNKAAATVILGDLAQTYDGGPHTVSVSTVPAGLGYTLAYDGGPTPPVNAGSYAVAVTVTDANYAGEATGTLVVARAGAAITFGSLTVAYDGAPKPVAVTTVPTGLPVALTYNGSPIAPKNAGNYAVLAVVDQPNFTGAASDTLVITPAPASIALSGLLQSYDGTPRLVTATTVPAGLPVSITYDGSATAPVLPGAYDVEVAVTDPNHHGAASDLLLVSVTALVRRASSLNGGLDGSMQLAAPGNVTLNGNAWVSGDLLVPGTPVVKLNGSPQYGGTIDGTGAVEPASYLVTLSGNTALRHVVRRTDAPALPVVTAPAAPIGTRDVSINSAAQSAGDFATLRDLTLGGNAGDVAVPPGTYGSFTANGTSRLILGVVGGTEPSEYNLQGLALNGASRLVIVGPVALKLAIGGSLHGMVNESGEPGWLEMAVASGGLTLNSNVVFNGYVVAPGGTITINDGSTLTGGVIADQLVINGNGRLVEPVY